MTTARGYDADTDYTRVGEFLVRTYRTTGDHINWFLPRWEYMHHHPLIENVDLRSFGIWEDAGEIVGVVHLEHDQGFAYFEIDPAHSELTREMLAYAETHLSAPVEGGSTLNIFINDRDVAFQSLAAGAGYRIRSRSEQMSSLVAPEPFPGISLVDGFQLRCLAGDGDNEALSRLLYRGFNHGDEPSKYGGTERTSVRSAPHYDPELHIVAVAPDGTFASYCGIWHES